MQSFVHQLPTLFELLIISQVVNKGPPASYVEQPERSNLMEVSFFEKVIESSVRQKVYQSTGLDKTVQKKHSLEIFYVPIKNYFV